MLKNDVHITIMIFVQYNFVNLEKAVNVIMDDNIDVAKAIDIDNIADIKDFSNVILNIFPKSIE